MSLVKSIGKQKVNVDFNKDFINLFSDKIKVKDVAFILSLKRLIKSLLKSTFTFCLPTDLTKLIIHQDILIFETFSLSNDKIQFKMDIEFKISKKPVNYKKAIDTLEKRVNKVKKGDRELVWFLEHPTTFTGGVRYRKEDILDNTCLLYTSPSPRDRQKSRMPSSA